MYKRGGYHIPTEIIVVEPDDRFFSYTGTSDIQVYVSNLPVIKSCFFMISKPEKINFNLSIFSYKML